MKSRHGLTELTVQLGLRSALVGMTKSALLGTVSPNRSQLSWSAALALAAVLIGIKSVHNFPEPHSLPGPYTLWVLLVVASIDHRRVSWPDGPDT